MPAHMRVLTKPPKGEAKADRRKRRRASKSREIAAKRDAKARDKHCRVPGCRYPQVLEAMHLSHAGMGGDPTLLRGGTARDYVTGCQTHHRMQHDGYLEMTALGEKRGDGVVSFRRRVSLHGPWLRIGVSDPLGEMVPR